MRRWTLAALAVMLGATLLSPAPSTAAAPAAERTVDDPALIAVRSVLGVDAPLVPGLLRRTVAKTRPHLSLAMRELFLALPRLDARQQREAQAYLARPTNGASDPFGDGYTVPARKKCQGHICIHWVRTTKDAPPNRAWVDTTLSYVNKVWRTEVGKLGYRKPMSDGRRGGNGKLDIYLKDLGARSVYGYCAPERRAAGRKWLASGYCVLDNDFARAQYGGEPRASMRVTAAHEFFHAVQYAYDYAEDPWLLEGTATWMEERVADDVNDNRQYLPHGQVGRPGRSLDSFVQTGFNQYGNWAFFEYLSGRFGAKVIRQIWERAGAYPGAGRQYSTNAVKSVLAGRGGFKSVFRSFAAGNVVPRRTYREGKSWPAAPARRTWTLTGAERSADGTLKINHMAAAHVRIRPGDGVQSRGWRLRVAVDGPHRRTDPAAYLVVKRKKGVTMKPIRLNAQAEGRVTVPFGSRQVRSVTVVLVNASTRFSCWHETTWSCQGRARDNQKPFAVTATALAPG